MTDDPRDAERLANLDDWRHKRCGHNFEIANCPYVKCDARDTIARLTQERDSARASHFNAVDEFARAKRDWIDKRRSLEQERNEARRNTEVLLEGVEFAHGWIAGLPREPSFEDKRAAQAALELARDTAQNLERVPDANTGRPPIVREGILTAGPDGRDIGAPIQVEAPAEDDVERARDFKKRAKPLMAAMCYLKECRFPHCIGKSNICNAHGEAVAQLFHEHDAALTAARRDGFKEAIDKTTPGWRDLNTALRMIRDAVEELGPAGSIPSRDVGPPDYTQDAEDIIAGINRLVDAARREERERVGALDEALNYVADNTYCGADAEWHFKPGYDPQIVLDATTLVARDAAHKGTGK